MDENKKIEELEGKMNSYNRQLDEIEKATNNFNNRVNSVPTQDNRFSNLAHNKELDNSQKLSSHDKTGPRISEQGKGLPDKPEGIPNSNNIGNNRNEISKNNNLNSNNKGNNLSKASLDNKNNSKSLGQLANQGAKNKIANKLLDKNPKTRMIKNLISKKQSFGSKNAGSSFFRNSSLMAGTSNSVSALDKKDQLEDSSESEGLTNVKVSKKLIVTIAAILAPTFVAVVFAVLIVAATQTFLTANKLDQADSISDDDAIDKIDKIFGNEEKLNEEVDDVSYIFDIYVDESVTGNKRYEFATKKGNQIDPEKDESNALNELKDFYPDIVKYDTENFDKYIVYRFFTKLYNIYHYYAGQGVKLDIPLMMSVLNLQSTDAEKVFESNTVDYDKAEITKGIDNPNFDIKKDWSNYKSTKENSSHDIEVLAQAMVKEGSSKSSSSSGDGNYVDGIEFMTGGIGDIYYFNQLDYPDEPYGSYGTIASHGCGPTSLSIVVSSLLKEVHDPVELTDYVCSIGGCTDGGSTWDSITDTPPHYGLQVNRTTDTQEVISALGTGKSLAIAIMCPGHFTSGGHFIVLTATNSNGQVTVADPASRDRSTDWDFNIVAEENCGAYWIINK